MPTLPSALSLTTIADGSPIIAADPRNNFSAIQTAVNSLLTTLGGGASGQVLTGNGTTVTWGPASTAYTPTWSSSGTQPVLGNGTLLGSWIQVGKLVACTAVLTTGSTSTYGTGSYKISLPVASLANSTVAAIGNGAVYNTGGTNVNNVLWIDNGNLSLNQLGFTQVSPTVPITFASASGINLTGIYIAA